MVEIDWIMLYRDGCVVDLWYMYLFLCHGRQ